MTKKKYYIAVTILCGTLMLSACGTTKTDRAVSGGAIGAGVGAVGGAVTGGNPLGGALIGGAVGAATGALTTKKQIDLDR